MSTPQGGILADVPGLSRYLEFSLIPDSDPVQVLRDLATRSLGADVVVGLGAGLVSRLGGSVEGLRSFRSVSGPGCDVPSTQAGVWCWIRGADRGEITHLGRSVARQLAPAFQRNLLVDGFKYDISRDLS